MSHKISIGPEILHDLPEALKREWLETNGRGGWASSSIIGTHTRRYHGMLVVPSLQGAERLVMLSRLDEVLQHENEKYDLSTSQYPNTFHPQGFRYLKKFERDIFPIFYYQAGSFRFTKTIAAIAQKDVVIVQYQFETAPSGATLELNPLVAGRAYHNLVHANSGINSSALWTKDELLMAPYRGLPEVSIKVAHAQFVAAPQWYYRFEYAEERARGYPYQEDLFSYGTLSVPARGTVTIQISLSKESDAITPEKLLATEQQRRSKIEIQNKPKDELEALLLRAADQFLIETPSQEKTILAGYPWFTDWGRDSMIALPGLFLSTGRLADAQAVLQRFAHAMFQGLIPNRFPDGSAVPEFNTADGTLWFFIACYQYWIASKDVRIFKSELYDRLVDSIEWHQKGTLFDIGVGADGLLNAGNPNTQLTWMDAKVNEHPITPRFGKAVELNALWINALRIVAEIGKAVGEKKRAVSYEALAKQAEIAFTQQFWSENIGYLADVIFTEPNGVSTADWSCRPNQAIALSLPFEVLEPRHARRALSVITTKLFTPLGLRTLAPDDPRYRGTYEGDKGQRDAAYHQGTVWPWLMGAYLRTLKRYGDFSEYREKAASVFTAMGTHLHSAGLGSVSEICDGNYPHAARGAPFQAWSVAEILREYREFTRS